MVAIQISTASAHLNCYPVSPTVEQASSRKGWNRWLLSIQLFTAPFFITITGWTNLDPNLDPRKLLIPALCSILISCIFLASLLFSTKINNQAPSQSRPLLAFLGFAVSIAWISTLATEVVNVLKTLGVILSISDSLLGLTIFAVGNSLGDRVAHV